MTPPSSDPRRANLRIHGLALALVALAWVALALSISRGPPDRVLDLSGLVLVFWGLVALAYVGVSSAILAALYRRRGAALVLHGVGLGVVAGVALIGDAIEREEARARPATLARAAEEDASRALRACLRVDAIRLASAARPLDLGDMGDSPMTIEVVLANRCASAFVVGDVDLIGFPPGGGNRILGLEERRREAIPAAGARTFVVRAHLPGSGEGELRRWAWRSNVELVDPDLGPLCFATADAPATAGCQAIEPAVIGGGR